MPTKIRSVSPESQEVYLNDDLPILYVDACALSTSQGGLNYLSFATNTPNAKKTLVEQVRLVIDDESLRMILNELCDGINYFPEKPTKRRKRQSK